LEPRGSDCPSLARWLAFLKSDEGQKWTGGTISQHLSPGDADRPSVDLKARMRDLADMFCPWIEASGPIAIPPVADTLRPTFEERLQRLPKIQATKTYGQHGAIKDLMKRLANGLRGLPALREHPNVRGECRMSR